MTVEVLSSPSDAVHDGTSWNLFTDGRVYECEVVIVREREGFSTHAAKLPGVVGEGDTPEDAVGDIVNALQDVLAEYLAAGEIPWTVNAIDGEVVSRKWILVNV